MVATRLDEDGNKAKLLAFVDRNRVVNAEVKMGRLIVPAASRNDTDRGQDTVRCSSYAAAAADNIASFNMGRIMVNNVR